MSSMSSMQTAQTAGATRWAPPARKKCKRMRACTCSSPPLSLLPSHDTCRPRVCTRLLPGTYVMSVPVSATRAGACATRACHHHAPCCVPPTRTVCCLRSLATRRVTTIIFSSPAHRLPRVEDAATRDPKRPGTLERTLDCVTTDTPQVCVSADTTQVLFEDVSEYEKVKAQLAKLELEKTLRNRQHREQKRINKQASKNNGKALEMLGEAIMVLSRVVPTLRALPKFRADTLSVHVLICLHEALAAALWLTTRRRVETDEGDYTQLLPMRECAISAGLGIVAETAYSVIQIVQKLEAMNNETSVNEEASLPAMLHTVSTLLRDARTITKSRLQEANDTQQQQRLCSRTVTDRTPSAPRASASASSPL